MVRTSARYLSFSDIFLHYTVYGIRVRVEADPQHGSVVLAALDRAQHVQHARQVALDGIGDFFVLVLVHFQDDAVVRRLQQEVEPGELLVVGADAAVGDVCLALEHKAGEGVRHRCFLLLATLCQGGVGVAVAALAS